MQWETGDLGEFVNRSDALGGPGSPACEAFWQDFSVKLVYQVDDTLAPLSDEYVAEQMRLYNELSGRTYEPNADEKTSFDLERHVYATNPYDHPDAAEAAKHIQRLSRALRLGRAARDDLLIDMGCGWGLSSELAAYIGLQVIAVDINPDFISLIRQRVARTGARITPVQSTFDTFVPDASSADMVLFYESLHHAVRPWSVIARAASALKPGGRLVLAGEPVNAIWWQHWGLRLDAISIYCIRKFGWFESGWSLRFIKQLMFRAGLQPVASRDADSQIDLVIVGTKKTVRLSGAEAIDLFHTVGCVAEAEHGILIDTGSLSLCFPGQASQALLHIINHRNRALHLEITCNGADVFRGDVLPGTVVLPIFRNAELMEVKFVVERWIPAAELGNGDTRVIGVHLSQITFAM